MTEKDNEKQPWEASFKDDETNQYSRTQNRRKSQRVSLVVGVLVLIVIALSFVPVYKYLQALNKPIGDSINTELPVASSTKTTTTTSKVTETAKSEAKAKRAAASASIAAAKSASRAADSSRTAASLAEKSSQADAASSSAAMSASQAASESQASSESSASSDATGSTVTFDSGTLYSFAVANGTTPAELYALNPGLSDSNYASYYGQGLKVK